MVVGITIDFLAFVVKLKTVFENFLQRVICWILSFSAAQCALIQPNRGMANLKIIAMRLKSVKNIQKITQSMKMVSAAKYARAERDLKAARPYGDGAQSFYKGAGVMRLIEPHSKLFLAKNLKCHLNCSTQRT